MFDKSRLTPAVWGLLVLIVIFSVGYNGSAKPAIPKTQEIFISPQARKRDDMTKIHYQGLPCNSKSWTEGLAGGTILEPDGKGNLIQSDIEIIDEPLPQTHVWGKVTCQKCLRSKPGEKATPKQRISINHLKKLIKGWPTDLKLTYDPDTEWIVVLYDREVLAKIHGGNLKIQCHKA